MAKKRVMLRKKWGHSSIQASKLSLYLDNQVTYGIDQTHPFVNRFDHAFSKPSTL